MQTVVACAQVEHQEQPKGLRGFMWRVRSLCSASLTKLSAGVCCRSTAVMP